MLIYCVEILLHNGLKGFQGGTILNAIFQTVPESNCSIGKGTLACGRFTNQYLKRVPFARVTSVDAGALNELFAEVLWCKTII